MKTLLLALLLPLLLTAGCCEHAEPAGLVDAESSSASLLSTYLKSGSLLSPASSKESRAPLIGTHSADDGNQVALLILTEGASESSTQYLWLRMDNYCGQIGESSSGSWDIVDGEIQLFPVETVPPQITPDLASSAIYLLEGHLVWMFEGRDHQMSYDVETWMTPSPVTDD